MTRFYTILMDHWHILVESMPMNFKPKVAKGYGIRNPSGEYCIEIGSLGPRHVPPGPHANLANSSHENINKTVRIVGGVAIRGWESFSRNTASRPFFFCFEPPRYTGVGYSSPTDSHIRSVTMSRSVCFWGYTVWGGSVCQCAISPVKIYFYWISHSWPVRV